MREFTNLVYLDLQKAASTSISSLLRGIVDETEIYRGAHSWAEEGHDTQKFHFISVRNPLTCYISLFGHGCSKLGGMYKGFVKRGLDDLYVPSVRGFEKWLEFTLRSENDAFVKKKYHNTGLGPLAGPLTYRLLMLSVVEPLRTLKWASSSKDEIRLGKFFHGNRLYFHYVRTEHLADDLFDTLAACSDRVKFKIPLTTVDDLRKRIPRKNIGTKVPGLTPNAVSTELQERVRERERLFCEVFGYDEDAGGRPPPLPPVQEEYAIDLATIGLPGTEEYLQALGDNQLSELRNAAKIEMQRRGLAPASKGQGKANARKGRKRRKGRRSNGDDV